MAPLSRVEEQFDIKLSAKIFYGDFRNNMGRLVQLVPENIKSYKIVQGNEFGNGAVVVWTYNLGQSQMIIKLRQDTNDASKTITFTVLDGDILKKFNSFVVNLKVESGAAIWSIEFEKIDPSTTDPTEYLELFKKFTREFDAHPSNT